MKIHPLLRDILFLLFAFYFSQGFLYAQGSLLSQSSLALILLISTFYFLNSLLRKSKNQFYRAWTSLFLLNLGGFIFTGSISNSSHFGMFRSILISSLPFYPFYFFSQKGILLPKHLKVFFLVILPITVAQFFFNQSQVLAERISDSTDLVNNIAYSFVALIPFLFLFNTSSLLSISFMIFLMYFIIQGAKRGALISGAIGFGFFIYFKLRTLEKKNLIKGYFALIVGLVILGYFSLNFYQENEFLVNRIQSIGEEGGASGRDIIYKNVFAGWYNSDSIVNLLFGFGFAASQKLSLRGNFAHNDWLELLSNFGLFGIAIYASLFYAAFKFSLNSFVHLEKRIMMMTICFIWIFITLVSMSYTSMNGYLQAMLLGYLIGDRHSENSIS